MHVNSLKGSLVASCKMSMSLGKLYFAQKLYIYAGIMLDAFDILAQNYVDIIGSSLSLTSDVFRSTWLNV